MEVALVNLSATSAPAEVRPLGTWTVPPQAYIYERKKREGEISFENQKLIKTEKRWGIFPSSIMQPLAAPEGAVGKAATMLLQPVFSLVLIPIWKQVGGRCRNFHIF